MTSGIRLSEEFGCTCNLCGILISVVIPFLDTGVLNQCLAYADVGWDSEIS